VTRAELLKFLPLGLAATREAWMPLSGGIDFSD
jgi:hypothetical protein